MIPYTVERRADTRVNNVTLGIWLFLASEVMLFGALFSAYALLRVAAVSWPQGSDILNVPLGATNTVILLGMTTLAWRAPQKGGWGGRRLLTGSSLLAVLFLMTKGVEWWGEIVAGQLPSTSTFLAIYFTLTGLHALHVLCGVVANVWAITGVKRVGEPMTDGRLHALSLYWAFVDVVWMVIFVLLYLT
jgi:cytochrome c oxidase subunit III